MNKQFMWLGFKKNMTANLSVNGRGLSIFKNMYQKPYGLGKMN